MAIESLTGEFGGVTSANMCVSHHTDGSVNLTQSFGGAALDNKHDLTATAPSAAPTTPGQ